MTPELKGFSRYSVMDIANALIHRLGVIAVGSFSWPIHARHVFSTFLAFVSGWTPTVGYRHWTTGCSGENS